MIETVKENDDSMNVTAAGTFLFKPTSVDLRQRIAGPTAGKPRAEA
jgi:hypothetical protein